MSTTISAANTVPSKIACHVNSSHTGRPPECRDRRFDCGLAPPDANIRWARIRRSQPTAGARRSRAWANPRRRRVGQASGGQPRASGAARDKPTPSHRAIASTPALPLRMLETSSPLPTGVRQAVMGERTPTRRGAPCLAGSSSPSRPNSRLRSTLSSTRETRNRGEPNWYSSSFTQRAAINSSASAMVTRSILMTCMAIRSRRVRQTSARQATASRNGAAHRTMRPRQSRPRAPY